VVGKKYALFTGLLRVSKATTNQTIEEKIALLKKYGIEIFFFSWKNDLPEDDYRLITQQDVNVQLLDSPVDDNGNVMHHKDKSIIGRQRQIYMAQKGVECLEDNSRILKLRWDLYFNEELLKNFVDDTYLDPISHGILSAKIWVSFFSIQELLSVSDQCYFGFKEDLEKLIKFNYKLNNISANNFISHDGMHLMPIFVAQNQELQDLIRTNKPDPHSLMFKKEHLYSEPYLRAWAYTYYIYNKYFKTGPLGTAFFKKGDTARWPSAIVDYDGFYKNYETVISTKGRLNHLPRYRVYDDVFVKKLVAGHYRDDFAQSIHNIIKENKEHWEAMAI